MSLDPSDFVPVLVTMLGLVPAYFTYRKSQKALALTRELTVSTVTQAAFDEAKDTYLAILGVVKQELKETREELASSKKRSKEERDFYEYRINFLEGEVTKLRRLITKAGIEIPDDEPLGN